ncbi:MAG: TRAP transporter small permease subunit [Deltaproteobacteria bacterium]|nr:TRAP transporter small permease subunit [Deltaproteobacteria bacterium]
MPFIKTVDRLSEWTGSLSAWLIIPLILVVLYEVTMRYFFNSPTVWVYDVSWMIFAAQFLLGGAFTYLRKGHIRIDIVYGTLSERAKRIYDFLINLIIIVPPMVLFGWAGVIFSAKAYSIDERLSTGTWPFPTGPPKMLIPIGFFLLALQSLAEIVRICQKPKRGGKP